MIAERWYEFAEVVRLTKARQIRRIKRAKFTGEAAKLRRKVFKNGRRK